MRYNSSFFWFVYKFIFGTNNTPSGVQYSVSDSLHKLISSSSTKTASEYVIKSIFLSIIGFKRSFICSIFAE